MFVGLSVFFPLLTICYFANGANSSYEDWPTVDRLQPFKDLDPCAKDCVRNVNQQIFDVRAGRTCVSYGCVCSENTQGPNFIAGLGNVTECVKKSCTAQHLIDAAVTAYGDLCLIKGLNSTRPPVEEGMFPRINDRNYNNLTDCGKFLLNGCLDAKGTRNEPRCKAKNEIQGWENYRGVAATRRCNDFECLCHGGNFDASYDAIADAGIRYCSMRPSVEEDPNKEIDDVMVVFVNDCAAHEFITRNFTWTYSGIPPGSHKENKISTEGAVQIGLSAFAALLTFLATIASIKTWWLMRKAPTLPSPQLQQKK